jgi:hypothetical protein
MTEITTFILPYIWRSELALDPSIANIYINAINNSNLMIHSTIVPGDYNYNLLLELRSILQLTRPEDLFEVVKIKLNIALINYEHLSATDFILKYLPNLFPEISREYITNIPNTPEYLNSSVPQQFEATLKMQQAMIRFSYNFTTIKQGDDSLNNLLIT